MITTSYTLTERQDAYIAGEAQRLQIGKSEFMRRVLDEVIDRPGERAAQPVVTFAPQDPDQGGSTTVRVWKSSHARLMELSTRTGLSNPDMLDRLLRLPDATIFALLGGDYAQAPTVDPHLVKAIPLPADGDNMIDRFLAEKCVCGAGVACSMEALYRSYAHFCEYGDSAPASRGVFWDHLGDRGFVALRQNSTVPGLGLRKSAWAVMTGEAEGYEIK